MVACQHSSPQRASTLPATLPILQRVPIAAPLLRVVHGPKSVPHGTLQPMAVAEQEQPGLKFSIAYPRPDFGVQAFGCGEVAFASIQVTGPGIPAPIYANGADAQNMLAVVGCNISGTLNSVPYGDVVVTIKLYNTQREFLSGSELVSGMRFDSATTALEMSYRQVNVGQLLQKLLAGTLEEQFLSQQVNIHDLQAFFDTVTGVGGTFPNYTFTTHPALVNTDKVIAELKANGGDATLLNGADPAYRLTAGSAQFNVQGVLPGQSVQASVDDMLSADVTINGNGAVTIQNLPPGEYTLRLSGNSYISQQVPVTVTANQQIDLGTVTMKTRPSTLIRLSRNSGVSGEALVLMGSDFNTVATNNIVRFGNTQATVNSVNNTGTELNVTVPAGLSLGNQAVTVTVGNSVSSAALNFNVLKPEITSLSTTGATLGSSININGSNFNTVTANHAVTIGGQTATVTAASATQLTVTVPGGLSGTVPVTVRNLQSIVSDPVNLEIIPTLTTVSPTRGSTGDSITLIGAGFDDTDANNTVRFGAATATIISATPTQIVATLTEAPAGSVLAFVQVGTQTSVGSAFARLPKIGALTTATTEDGKAVLIRSEVLTITGTNFDPTPGNNTVKFGAITATPTAATATQLTVTVPGNVGTPGDVAVSVTTNAQDSNSMTATVPTINLNFNGGFQ